MFERYSEAMETTDEEIQRLARDERLVHFAGTIIPPRVGVRLFVVKLEYFYFEPGTPRNDEFIFHVINWQDMNWVVVSIPKEYMELAKKVATEVGLRIADGVPHVITARQVYVFPMNTENVFTLENVSGHEVYNGNEERIMELLAEESQEIEEIFDKHKSSSNN